MKEIKDIIGAYDHAQVSGQKTALATVVHVEGSSYRRPGARMLITETGQLTGAISGGCLEGDALRKALLVMAQQQPMLVTYDTTDEEDAKLGVQLGCNGIIHILIEPVDPTSQDNPVQLLKMITARREPAVLITFFSLGNRKAQQPGTSLLLSEQGITTGAMPDDTMSIELKTATSAAFEQQCSSIRAISSPTRQYDAFIEYIPPAISLIIAGAGNDVMPLVQMAHIIGWPVTVVDGRNNYATSARFPTADRVLVSKPDNLPAQVMIDSRTVVLLMTHNYNYDLAMLQTLRTMPMAYIGVLGPIKKMQRLLHDLEQDGTALSESFRNALHGPVGLDIGAETPEEIALSVLSEIRAVMSGRPGGQLRDNISVIHPRSNKQNTI